jgi:hypothetical protein
MNHTNGTYVALEVDPFCRRLIDDFSRQSLRLDNRVDPDTLHTTVIYSRAPVPEAYGMRTNCCVVARPIAYEIFPTSDGKRCLVLLVESTRLRDLNEMLVKCGATSDYDRYNPHVTLSYDFTESLSDLPLPPFSIQYDTLTVEPLDEEYVPPSAE